MAQVAATKSTFQSTRGNRVSARCVQLHMRSPIIPGCLLVALFVAPHADAAARYGWPLQPRPPVVTGYDPPAQRWLPGHRGVDLAASAGQPVTSAGDGTVTFAGQVGGRPVVSIRHSATLWTTYEPVEAQVREGDTVVVHSMDRLARNLDDLRRIVQGLTQRGVRMEFVKEGLTFTGEDSPMANLMLSVMGAFAEFERALIRERQREGIVLAKQRGAYRGRKKSLNSEQIAELKRRVAAGDQKTLVARDFGISRETLYQYLRED